MFKFGVVALLGATVFAKKKAGESDGKTFQGTEYISLSAEEKSDQIWSYVTASDESGSWHFGGTLVVDENPVFDTPGDEFECTWSGCRNKTIHSIGNVCKI